MDACTDVDVVENEGIIIVGGMNNYPGSMLVFRDKAQEMLKLNGIRG